MVRTGELNTYWLETTSDSRNGSSRSSDSCTDSGRSANDDVEPEDEMVAVGKVATRASTKAAPKQLTGKIERLIDWNVDVLIRLLQQIVARRDVTFQPFDIEDTAKPKVITNPFDEVKEIIALPEFKETRKLRDPNDVTIPENVVAQLRDYVAEIAMLYNENPFHNFEHVRFCYTH
jgi:hypothetical protein